MISLKLGFVGISLATAFWAITDIEPRLSHDQQPHTLHFSDVRTHAGTANDAQQGSNTSTSLQYQETLNHYAPNCLDSSCYIGTLLSRASQH